MVKAIARYFLQLRSFSQNARFYLTSEVITGLTFHAERLSRINWVVWGHRRQACQPGEQ